VSCPRQHVLRRGLQALVEVSRRVGDAETAREALTALVELQDGGGELLDAVALSAEAELVAGERRLGSAIAALRRAVDLLNELGFPYETARRRVRLSQWLRESGDPSAELELEHAGQVFAALGAGPDLAEVDALRGVDRAEGGPLSRREREVLALVARDRTNNDIAAELVISPHTVARHMTNIRTKLGVHSRAAAVAEANRRGWLVSH
jgi:ATP/maltotriose-dependent transcriptional regulator MalT